MRSICGPILCISFSGMALLTTGCGQPPLVPAPPDTGPELEALQLSQGLLAPFRVDSEPADLMRLEDRMDFYGVPGVSIAVIDDGEFRWAKSWGVKLADSEDIVTPSTRFQASSISKALTATVALRCVDQGRLSLDSDVSQEVSGWDPGPAAIREGATLGRLLSHTSGISQPGFEGYSVGAPLPSTQQILSGSPPANHQPILMVRPPGTAWQYSGGGYMLVQSLLEQETGLAFAELMNEQLLAPLQMSASAFEPYPSEIENTDVAIAHDSNGLPLPDEFRVYPELAAAGLWSTPTDLTQWVIEIQKAHAGKPGRRLKKSTVRSMLKPQQPGGWGLGVQLGGSGQAEWFGHLGGNTGFPALALGFVSSGHGAVIMANGDRGQGLIREIATGLARVYGWPTFQQETVELVTPSIETSLSLPGSYEIGALPGQPLLIERVPTEDGLARLHMSFLGQSDHLDAVTPDRWISRIHGRQITLSSVETGKTPAQQLTVHLFPNYRFLAIRTAEDPKP